VKPHVCPKCEGERTIAVKDGSREFKRVCPTCRGEGVVWREAEYVKRAIDTGGTDRVEK